MKTECPECCNVKRHREGCRYAAMEEKAEALPAACIVLAGKYPCWRDDPNKDDIYAWKTVTEQASDILSNKQSEPLQPNLTNENHQTI